MLNLLPNRPIRDFIKFNPRFPKYQSAAEELIHPERCNIDIYSFPMFRMISVLFPFRFCRHSKDYLTLINSLELPSERVPKPLWGQSIFMLEVTTPICYRTFISLKNLSFPCRQEHVGPKSRAQNLQKERLLY